MTAKTMAEVLNEADEKWSKEVGVSTPAEWADYIAAELSAAGFGLVADTKAEAKRDAAAAGVRAVCDVWGAGGRATVRLSELSEIAKDMPAGEWDQHIEWNLEDIARERARATKAAS